MNSWCCAFTCPGEEAKASSSLRAKGFRTLLPILSAETVVRGAVIVKREVMFPRYLFVELDLGDDYWTPALYAKGVAGFVRPQGGAPSRVPDGVMAELFERCGPDGEVFMPLEDPMNRTPIRKGDFVRVVEGPFSHFEGLCRRTKGERVFVLLSIFGRKSEFSLAREQVERVAL